MFYKIIQSLLINYIIFILACTVEIKKNNSNDSRMNNGVDTHPVITANQNASPATIKLLEYLRSLSKRTTKRVLSGQHFSYNRYNEEITALHTQTGYWPGLIGTDLYWHCKDCLTPDFSKFNHYLIDYWNKGGLITLQMHPGNPDKPGTIVGDCDINAIVTPGTPTNLIWTDTLKQIADGLEELKNAGVVVLWRPFHEMCGGFWWGMNNNEPPDLFFRLWKQMFDYFNCDRNLNNLLWVYNSGGCFGTYYPGDNYVDINSRDYYGNKPEDVRWSQNTMINAVDKPFALGEFGPISWNKEVVLENPKFDLTILRDAFKNDLTNTIWFLEWGQVWKLTEHLNAATLLSDPIMINRGDITYFNKN